VVFSVPIPFLSSYFPSVCLAFSCESAKSSGFFTQELQIPFDATISPRRVSPLLRLTDFLSLAHSFSRQPSPCPAFGLLRDRNHQSPSYCLELHMYVLLQFRVWGLFLLPHRSHSISRYIIDRTLFLEAPVGASSYPRTSRSRTFFSSFFRSPCNLPYHFDLFPFFSCRLSCTISFFPSPPPFCCLVFFLTLFSHSQNHLLRFSFLARFSFLFFFHQHRSLRFLRCL